MTLRDGAAVARARQMFGLAVDDMAARLGLPVAELRDIENGRDLPVKTRNKIERTLGFSLDDMFLSADHTSGVFTAQPYPLFLAAWNNGEVRHEALPVREGVQDPFLCAVAAA